MKRVSFIFLLLFSSFSLNAVDTTSIVSDDFNKDTEFWFTGDSDYINGEITDGKYIISTEGKDGAGWVHSNTDYSIYDNFILESRIRLADGPENYGFGLILGYREDDPNYFTINLSGNQLFYLEGKWNDENHTLQDWTEFKDVINPAGEWNDIKVTKNSGVMHVYVNGIRVYSYHAFWPKGKRFGFELGTKDMVLEVDNFQLKSFDQLIDTLVYTFADVEKSYIKELNTEFDEKLPVVSPDGDLIYYIIESHPENLGNEKKEDIWYSTMKNGKYTKPINIGPPLNNDGHNGVITMTPDGNVLYLKSIYEKDGTSIGGGISITRKLKDGWEFPSKISIKNYKNENDYVSNFLTTNREYLLVAIENESSLGEKDIFVCNKINDTLYSEPLNLGKLINTPLDEYNPYLASDNKTLYFASEGHPGFGSADIWISVRLDDSWTNWSKPKNLGSAINTNGYELSFTLSGDGNFAYMYSDEEIENFKGRSDIMKVKLAEEMKPEPVVIVQGNVYDKNTNEPLSVFIKYYDLKTNKILGSTYSDPENGYYSVILPRDMYYGINSQRDGYFPISENLNIADLNSNKTIRKDLYMLPAEVGQTIRLNNLFFDTGKWQLKDESMAELENLKLYLQMNKDLKIIINGHTDNIGTAEDNLILSQNRADAVYKWLIENKINEDRLEKEGFGENDPIESNETEEGRQLNRRVEFTILEN